MLQPCCFALLLTQFGLQAADLGLSLAELAGQVLVPAFQVFDVALGVLIGRHAAGDALEHELPGCARSRSDFPHHAFKLLFHIAALGLVEIAQLQPLGEGGRESGVKRIAVWKAVNQGAVELEYDFRAARTLNRANFEADFIPAEVETQNADLISDFETVPASRRVP